MNGQEIDINNFNAIKFIGKQLLITMSFIFALAWNDAFKNFFKRIPHLQKYGPWIYALSITLILVIFVHIMIFFLKKLDKLKKKNKNIS